MPWSATGCPIPPPSTCGSEATQRHSCLHSSRSLRRSSPSRAPEVEVAGHLVTVGDRRPAAARLRRTALSARQQRVRNRQPLGGSIGLGGSPTSTIRDASAFDQRVGDRRGRQQRLRVRVGGRLVQTRRRRRSRRSCRGTSPRRGRRDGAPPTRSWAMNRYDSPSRRGGRSSRRMTSAWMLTSSAETGSSSTSSAGRERQRPGDADRAGAGHRRTRAGTVGGVGAELHQLEQLGDARSTLGRRHAVHHQRLGRRSRRRSSAGCSDACGSWNTIWKWRRSARAARRCDSCVSSSPSNLTLPAVGSMRRRMQRPWWTCRSPTRRRARAPRRRRTSNDTPVTACTAPAGVRHDVRAARTP